MVIAKLVLILTVLVPFAVAIAACGTKIETPREPVLATVLKSGRSLADSRGDFDNAGLSIGEKAVNFTLRDIHGSVFRLSQLLAEKPVMMVLGSFT